MLILLRILDELLKEDFSLRYAELNNLTDGEKYVIRVKLHTTYVHTHIVYICI